MDGLLLAVSMTAVPLLHLPYLVPLQIGAVLLPTPHGLFNLRSAILVLVPGLD